MKKVAPSATDSSALCLRLHRDVKHRAKLQAVLKDQTLREWIIEAVTEKLTREKRA